MLVQYGQGGEQFTRGCRGVLLVSPSVVGTHCMLSLLQAVSFFRHWRLHIRPLHSQASCEGREPSSSYPSS